MKQIPPPMPYRHCTTKAGAGGPVPCAPVAGKPPAGKKTACGPPARHAAFRMPSLLCRCCIKPSGPPSGMPVLNVHQDRRRHRPVTAGAAARAKCFCRRGLTAARTGTPAPRKVPAPVRRLPAKAGPLRGTPPRWPAPAPPPSNPARREAAQSVQRRTH